jgi:hypothetical protein
MRWKRAAAVRPKDLWGLALEDPPWADPKGRSWLWRSGSGPGGCPSACRAVAVTHTNTHKHPNETQSQRHFCQFKFLVLRSNEPCAVKAGTHILSSFDTGADILLHN